MTIDDLARAERRVSVLMGDKPAPRRKWIEDNIKFTLEETGCFNGVLFLLEQSPNEKHLPLSGGQANSLY